MEVSNQHSAYDTTFVGIATGACAGGLTYLAFQGLFKMVQFVPLIGYAISQKPHPQIYHKNTIRTSVSIGAATAVTALALKVFSSTNKVSSTT